MLINSPSVVRDLIEKRGSLYAARPDWFIRETVGKFNIALREYHDASRFFIHTLHLTFRPATMISGDG